VLVQFSTGFYGNSCTKRLIYAIVGLFLSKQLHLKSLAQRLFVLQIAQTPAFRLFIALFNIIIARVIY
jgi:hypothetical protein